MLLKIFFVVGRVKMLGGQVKIWTTVLTGTAEKKKILIMHFAFKLQTFYSVTEVPYNMRNRRRMWVILQCTDVSQAAEHSFSQVCDLIVTQVKTLQETETRKHPILQTTQVIERQIPGNQTHKHALHSKNKD